MRITNQLNKIRCLQKTPLIALLWLFLGTACTLEEDNDAYIDEGRNVYLSVSALNSKSAPAEPDETINTVRVIIAKGNDEGTIITNIFGVTNPLGIDTKSGLYDVYVITNESETVGGELLELNAIKNIAELKNRQGAFDLTKREITNLPMFGVVRNVHISVPVSGVSSSSNPGNVQANGQNYGSTLPVSVNRLAIKISLRLMSKSFEELESVTLTNIPDSVSLLGDAYECTDNTKLQTISISDWVERTPLPSFIWERETKNYFYLPSNILKDPTNDSKAIKLEVKEVGKDKRVISLGHLIEASITTKDYTLCPNTVYTFVGRISGNELTIDASIADWLKKDQNYPAGGGKWSTQPKGVRIGINPVAGGIATFNAKFGTNDPKKYYQWYQKYQTYNDVSNKLETVIKALTNMNTDTLKIEGATGETLTITTKKIDVSGEIYCVASTTSPDGSLVRSESEHVTLMAVGENYQWPKNSFPSMQEFKAPLNAPLGSTCILQDTRENDENVYNIYHVKLMSDGNWWMIQDLAFGGTVDSWDKSESVNMENIIAPNTYGIAMKTGLPTGGHYYNTYAAIQFTSTTKEEWDTNKGKDKEYLQAVCPDGWHVPGNYDGKFNQEWLDFKTRNGVDYLVVSDFTYNSPTAFNTYTENANTVDIKGRFFFAGGCSTVRPGGSAGVNYYFRSQGAILGNHVNISIGNSVDETVQTTDKVMIRCVKNFK